MQLATTVSIPVVRNPVAMAKTLSSIDHLSEGKLFIGVGRDRQPETTKALESPLMSGGNVWTMRC